MANLRCAFSRILKIHLTITMVAVSVFLLCINETQVSAIDGPAVTWAPGSLEVSKVSGNFTLGAESAGTTRLIKWCLNVTPAIDLSSLQTTFLFGGNIVSAVTTDDTGCWLNTNGIGQALFDFYPSKWTSGTRVFSVSATDVNGQIVTTQSKSIEVVSTSPSTSNKTSNDAPEETNPKTSKTPNLAAPRIESYSVSSPAISRTTEQPRILVSAQTSHASKFEIRYGPSKYLSLKKSGAIAKDGEISFVIGGASAGFDYFVQLTISGPKGLVKSSVKTVRVASRVSKKTPTSNSKANATPNSGNKKSHGTVVQVYCDLHESGMSSSWSGQSYYWTIWNVYQDGTRSILRTGSGYDPPSLCE